MQKFISDEEVRVGGYKFLPHVSVLNTKRDGTLKYRVAPDGGKEPISDFVPGSLSSSGIDSPSFNFLMAYGAHHNMAASFSDVKQAYPWHNRWDDEACKNPRRVYIRLTAFQSGTGKEENLELLTATNGLRDASAIFEGINARMLFAWGARRSIVHRGLFFRHEGNNSLMVVGTYVDDSAELRSRDEGGKKMLQELEKAREVAGFQMKVRQLDDHPEGIDFAGRLIKPFVNKYGQGYALTQPSMHTKITECFEELGFKIKEEVNWLPVSSEWSPIVVAQGLEAGTPTHT
jgi:hypothetical protein